MPRKETHGKEEGALQRVAGAVKRLFSRGRVASAIDGGNEPLTSAAAPRRAVKKSEGTARPIKREADSPLDVLDRSYTPPRTSSKAGFRATGADHQRDQEFGRGVADDRWNDEDHYTNRSGDPRIGTHRRTYEPGEDRIETRE
jgi:hypothetical protein